MAAVEGSMVINHTSYPGLRMGKDRFDTFIRYYSQFLQYIIDISYFESIESYQ